jgi:hypothetical protein
LIFNKKRVLLALLPGWMVRFALFLCVFSLSLYILGNFRDFKEGVQFLLLRLSLLWGIVTVLVSVPGLFLSLGFFIYRRKPRRLLAACGYAFALLVGIAVSAALAFILAAAEGRGP